MSDHLAQIDRLLHPGDTYADRLLYLADFLDTVPPEHFDFSHWVNAKWEGSADPTCGATACALGWATTIPRFRELGLSLVVIPQSVSILGHPLRMIALRGKSGGSERATREIFGLNSREHAMLFVNASLAYYPPYKPMTEITPKEAAAAIRKFVAKKYPCGARLHDWIITLHGATGRTSRCRHCGTTVTSEHIHVEATAKITAKTRELARQRR